MADIGADHGLLPVRLLLERRVPRAIALDRAEASLGKAIALAARLGLGPEQGFVARRSEGLAALAPGEVATLVLAGLGGARIASILRARPELLGPGGVRRIVAQPNLEPQVVRAWALEVGWTLSDEALVRDAGRIYVVLVMEPLAPGAPAASWSEEDLLWGPVLRARRPPLLLEALGQELERLQQARAEAAGRAGAGAIRGIEEQIARVARELGR